MSDNIDTQKDFVAPVLGYIKDNIWLVIILACCVILGLFFKSAEGNTAKVKLAQKIQNSSPETAAPVAESAPSAPRPTPQETTLAIIHDYEQKVKDNPKGEDSPVYLFAQGNLYVLKLRDYKEASRCYEMILVDYPNWEKVNEVYMQLITCYEQLNDKKNLRGTCDAVMKRYPPESQEYLLAESIVVKNREL